MNTVTGTIRNVACKNSSERFEIWIDKNDAFIFPKKCTASKGCPIKVQINKENYDVNFHKTMGNKYIWLSTRKDQHQTSLTSILKRYSLVKNQKIEIYLIKNNLYKIIF